MLKLWFVVFALVTRGKKKCLYEFERSLCENFLSLCFVEFNARQYILQSAHCKSRMDRTEGSS